MTPLRNKAMNAFPTLVLRSPLHHVMSSRYLLLGFTGRNSGRRYTTPVAYVAEGERLLISTDSPLGRNVTGGRAVTLRLRGHTYSGTGQHVSDPAAGKAAMRALLAIPGYARTAGIERTNRTISDHEIHRATLERTIIAIKLGGRS